MKQTHTRRDKGRALFLAALMVLSVFAMSVSFAGAAAAQEETTRNALSDETFYQGQEVVLEAEYEPNEYVQIREGTTTESDGVRFVRADSAGTLTFDTSDLSEGPHILRDSDETTPDDGPFGIEVQNADISFESESIAQSSTSLNYDSDNRGEAVDLVVSAEGELDESDLAQVFENNELNIVEGDGEITIEGVEPGTSLNADFSNVEPGEYNVTVSVADSTAEEELSIEVTEDVEANAQFDASVYAEEIGDVAQFTIDLEGDNEANVVMQDGDDYKLTYTVVDGNGDGEVTVNFNSYNAGQNVDAEQIVSAEHEDDSVTNVVDTPLYDNGFNLQPSDLDLELYVNGDEETGVETDVATLGLNERSTGDVWTGVAPKGADLNDVESINDATTDGSEVAEGDSLIVKVDVSGIFGFLADENSSIGSEDGDAITFNLEQTNPDRYQNAHEFSLADEGVTVVSDSDDNALYFVIDTNVVADVEAGQEYDATFSVNDSYAYADDDESSETSFSVVERMNELTGEFDEEDRLQVGNEAEATVSGESTAAPGTDVQVRLRATGEDPFLMSQTVQVQEDGTFEATFDLSDNQVGQEFSISVTDMEEDANGIIVESGPAPHSVVIHVEDADGNAVSGAEITVGDQSATTDDDGKATLELAHGEYKVNASYDGVEANGKLTVDDQTPDEVTLTLGEEDVDYNEKANEDEQKDDEQKGDEQNDEKQSDEKQNDENNDDEQPGSGADEQPGFGIAVALIALLAAAGIALRRQ